MLSLEPTEKEEGARESSEAGRPSDLLGESPEVRRARIWESTDPGKKLGWRPAWCHARSRETLVEAESMGVSSGGDVEELFPPFLPLGSCRP